MDVKRAQREEEMGKRIGGRFVVSHLPKPSVELPPAPLCQGQTAPSPYSDVWRAGVAPGGRWILDGYLPRWVPEQSFESLSHESVDGWFSGYKDACDDFQAMSLANDVNDGMVTESRRQAPECMSQRSSEQGRDNDAFLPLASGGKEAIEDNFGSDGVVQSARSGGRKPINKASCKSPPRRAKTMRQNSKYKNPSKDDENDLEDILRPLDAADTVEAPDSLPRFEWVQRNISNLSNTWPSTGSRKASKAPPSTRLNSTSTTIESTLSEMSHATIKENGGITDEGYGLPHFDKGRDLGRSISKRKPKRPRALSIDSNAARGSMKADLASEHKWSVTSHHSSISGISGVMARNEYRARKEVRDQRAELKRLQQVLLSSSQQAFDGDVWEACGIEAEHLKRHQFAELFHGGLFKMAVNNDLGDDDEAATEVSAPTCPKNEDGKRVTWSALTGVKPTDTPPSSPGSIKSAFRKLGAMFPSSPKRSALKGGK